MRKLVTYSLVFLQIISCTVLPKMKVRKPDFGSIKAKLENLTKKKKKDMPVVVVSTPTSSNPVAIIIGKDSIRTQTIKEELALALDTLDRNNIVAQKKVVEEYLHAKALFIESEKAGYTRDEAYEQEMGSYRSVLSQAYLADSAYIKQMVHETYRWLQEEIEAAHILVSLPEFAPPADTALYYDKAIALRQRILSGENFADVARQTSADRKTAANGGNLGYFTALQIAYPFEKTAFNTPAGQISMPIRSKYGYHLIQVINRRPTLGKLKIAHIMVLANAKMSAEDRQKAKSKIDDLYQRLKQGTNFEELCKQYSDDINSRNKGGVLPIFGIGKYDEVFEKTAFGLNNSGDFSEPILSNEGWHILKLIEKIPLQSFEALEATLKEKVVTDSRGEALREHTIKKIKRDFEFTENTGIFSDIYTRLDTTLLKRTWRFSENDNILTKPIFSIENKTYTVRDFFKFMKETQRGLKVTPSSTSATIMHQLYKQFSDEEVRTYAENNMEKKVPEFISLMHEYRTGVLSSRLLNDRVYSPSTKDTTGQRLFYEAHRDLYRMPERINATIIECPDSKTFYQIKEVFTKDPPYALKVKFKNDLFFEFNEAALSDEHERNLIGLVASMKKNRNYVAEISSYADASESDTASSRRLKEVIKFLTRNGLELPRIIENDYFRNKQLSADASKNRRIVIQFLTNSKEDVARMFNAKNPNSVKITEKSFERGELALLDSLKWEKGIKRYDLADKIIEVHINELEPPRYKTLREARGLVIKSYQQELKQRLEADLRRKYPIQVNDAELEKIFRTTDNKQ